MQTDPNVRTMFAQFFGDPASRQFVQDSGNITSAMARPDNPWTPARHGWQRPATTSPGASFSPAAGPSGETGVAPGNPKPPTCTILWPADRLAERSHFPQGKAFRLTELRIGAAQLPARHSQAVRPMELSRLQQLPELRNLRECRLPMQRPGDYGRRTSRRRDDASTSRCGRWTTCHGARKALMLAFLGLNKFGAGLDHQQNSYGR